MCILLIKESGFRNNINLNIFILRQIRAFPRPPHIYSTWDICMCQICANEEPCIDLKTAVYQELISEQMNS